MARKEKLIPFRMLPASWGLVGAAFAEAEAHYNLDGEDLVRALVNIKFTDTERQKELLKLDYKFDRISEYDYEVELKTLETGELSAKDKLDIDVKFGKITPHERECQLVSLKFPDPDSLEHQLALLEADFEYGKITEIEYEKTKANAKNEHWVGVIESGFNSEDGVNGLYFKLDWNTQWVELLRMNGYNGTSEEEIVEQWFSDVSRSQLNDYDPHGPVPFKLPNLRS